MKLSEELKLRPLGQAMQSDQYAGYAYSYPHKTSYGKFPEPVELRDLWKGENKGSLFLYVHLPFCEFRCGFCNLFTTVQPAEELVAKTLDSISRQSRVVAEAVRPQRIAQVAFGGGTPSFLNVLELETLFQTLDRHWPIEWGEVPISFESSPATVTKEKLQLLRSYGVSRISMGVQSFSPADLKSLGRPQRFEEIASAVHEIKLSRFPVFNLDLIYGNEGQTLLSWSQTLDEALKIDPEEIYLYPLYVRKLTGLGRTGKSAQEERHEFYWKARSRLLNAGYTQRSMRLFRKQSVTETSEYSCQEDGMIGLGPGARSYTRALHYSSEFAVGQKSVRKIIHSFNQRSDHQYAQADYGVRLTLNEQKRRYFIKSILQSNGMLFEDYRNYFASDLFGDFATEINQLVDMGLANVQDSRIILNENGIAWSDTIGPWLYSPEVVARMEEFELE